MPPSAVNNALEETTGITYAIELFDANFANARGLSYQMAFTSAAATPGEFLAGEAEVTTITFLSRANTGNGDYFVLYDTDGLAWGMALDKSGIPTDPSGAIWTAIPAERKTVVDINGQVSAIQIGDAVANNGFPLLNNAPFTVVDNLDGTITFTGTEFGNTTDAVVKNATDSGNGSIVKTVGNQGVNSAVNHTYNGVAEVTTFTFEALTDTDPGDYFGFYDTEGLLWAASLDTTGTDPEPTGALWVSAAAGRKVHVDISGETTGADVATAVKTAIDALTDFPFDTDDSGGDGTLVITNTVAGRISDDPLLFPFNSNADDSGGGGVLTELDVEGIDPEVDENDNTITVSSHGYSTGRKGQLTTTGTLPAGVTTGVDYYIIAVDDDSFQLAASLSDAREGIAIELTNQGTDGATHTFTPVALAGASVKLQKSSGTDASGNELWNDEIGVTGRDVISANIAATGTINLCKQFLTGKKYRILVNLTAGELTVSGARFSK